MVPLNSDAALRATFVALSIPDLESRGLGIFCVWHRPKPQAQKLSSEGGRFVLIAHQVVSRIDVSDARLRADTLLVPFVWFACGSGRGAKLIYNERCLILTFSFLLDFSSVANKFRIEFWLGA